MGGLDALDGLELPPRTRRILVQGEKCGFRIGTTSACAENTTLPRVGKWEKWNYLRVRGEYAEAREKKIGMLELPPRTRRIPGVTSWCLAGVGTTSAYAENTPARQYSHGPTGNYLRVRGEYWDYQGDCEPQAELPPRTRRIQVFPIIFTPHLWNYLRVRGEYGGVFGGGDDGTELPPRTRRIQPKS